MEKILSSLGHEHIYVPGSGNGSAKIMLVQDFPDRLEEQYGQYMIGHAKKETQEMFALAGADLSEMYVTSVLKVRPPADRKGNAKVTKLKDIGFTIAQFVPQLHAEIQAINPNVIVPLGDLALTTLTGRKKMGDWRGSILKGWESRKYIGTHHPKNLAEFYEKQGVFKYSAKVYMQLDLNRIVRESFRKDIDLPIRTLRVCKSVVQLIEFLDRNRDKKRCSLDIEVHKAIPICIGLAFDSTYGLSVPLLNVDSQARSGGISKAEQALIWEILAKFLQREDIEWLGQNFHFDKTLMEYVCGIKIRGKTHDLMYKAQTLHPELGKGLAFLASIYTREPFYKNELKEYNPKKDKIDDVYFYNAKDVVVPFEVNTAMDSDIDELGLRDFYETRMLPMHQLYYDIEQRGIPIDSDVRDKLWIDYSRLQGELEAELQQLAGFDININSPKQVAIYLFEELKLPWRDSTDEDTLCGLLANHAKTDKQRRSMELIIYIRSVKTIKDSFIAARLDFDGRAKFLYNPAGTETGRSSGSKLNPPFRPIRGIGFNFQNLPKHGKLAKDIRRMFIPDKGNVFLNFDLSQAEPRIVAHLAKDFVLLEQFKNGVDVHRIMGGLCIGKDPAAISENERFLGKTTRNAMNYDGKKGTLMKTIMSLSKKFNLGVHVTEGQCNEFLKIGHAANPNVKGVYHKEVQEALANNHRILVTPYGRRRQFYDRWGYKLWGEAYANIPQGTVKDKLVETMLEVRKQIPEVDILGEAHDAFLCQVPIGTEDRVIPKVKEIMEAPIDFTTCTLSRGMLQLPCGVEQGENYADLEKVKV